MYKVVVFSSTYMPETDDGFTKETKHVACFEKYKILSENIVVIDGRFVY